MSTTVVFPIRELLAVNPVERATDQLLGRFDLYAGKHVVVGGGHTGRIGHFTQFDDEFVSVVLDE